MTVNEQLFKNNKEERYTKKSKQRSSKNKSNDDLEKVVLVEILEEKKENIKNANLKIDESTKKYHNITSEKSQDTEKLKTNLKAEESFCRTTKRIHITKSDMNTEKCIYDNVSEDEKTLTNDFTCKRKTKADSEKNYKPDSISLIGSSSTNHNKDKKAKKESKIALNVVKSHNLNDTSLNVNKISSFAKITNGTKLICMEKDKNCDKAIITDETTKRLQPQTTAIANSNNKTSVRKTHKINLERKSRFKELIIALELPSSYENFCILFPIYWYYFCVSSIILYIIYLIVRMVVTIYHIPECMWINAYLNIIVSCVFAKYCYPLAFLDCDDKISMKLLGFMTPYIYANIWLLFIQFDKKISRYYCSELY